MNMTATPVSTEAVMSCDNPDTVIHSPAIGAETDVRMGASEPITARGEADRRRRQTVTLLYGNLTFRNCPAKFVIADGDAAINHAQTVLPACIKETLLTTLDKSAYLQAACDARKATGDMFPVVARSP